MGMQKFFQPNIGKFGRILRAAIGLALLLVTVTVNHLHWLASAALVAGGLLCLYEAKRGWCIARACGLKTRW